MSGSKQFKNAATLVLKQERLPNQAAFLVLRLESVIH
jgi:hypothetical protein